VPQVVAAGNLEDDRLWVPLEGDVLGAVGRMKPQGCGSDASPVELAQHLVR
jgi:hypothetical protein